MRARVHLNSQIIGWIDRIRRQTGIENRVDVIKAALAVYEANLPDLRGDGMVLRRVEDVRR